MQSPKSHSKYTTSYHYHYCYHYKYVKELSVYFTLNKHYNVRHDNTADQVRPSDDAIMHRDRQEKRIEKGERERE